MSDFSVFAHLVKERFDALSKNELFVTDPDKDSVWSAYLGAFPEGTNPIFRERTEHDCACCKQFIRNIGNVVAVVGGKLCSVWDIEGAPYPYDEVAGSLAAHVKSFPISGLFRKVERRFGAEHTFEQLASGEPKKWHHFSGAVANKHHSRTPDKDCGEYATAAQVLERGLKELTPSAFATVIELTEANSLYRGAEFLPAVKEFQALQQVYQTASSDHVRNMLVWTAASKPVARFRNTVIGTLLVDISAGVGLDAAVRSFEAKVAPTNYKRPTAVITQRMVDDAVKTIGELGLEGALERRFAKISDVSVNNVLWVDNSVSGQMKDGIAGLLQSAVVAAKTVDKQQVENISIEDFVANVLPSTRGIELFMGNKLQNHLMSLTAPVTVCTGHPDQPNLFKWGNDFAWSYNGNITDSIKEKVKRAGGDTDAKLRVSLAWFNPDDLDIHVQCPDGYVYFGNKAGILDVDMNAYGPKSDTDPVENLSWRYPRDGRYQVSVNQFSKRSKDRPGFVIELAFDGKVSQFTHKADVSGSVVAISFSLKNGEITDLTVGPGLSGGGLSQEVWGVHTETFVKVTTVLNSPNHWDGNQVGNKHWLFMLDGCLNPEPARGIYNEYLNSALEPHRKVFEVLGSRTMCQPSAEQVSGVGFTAARGDTVMVRVTGDNFNKPYNIHF